jgi:hypothetical protein
MGRCGSAAGIAEQSRCRDCRAAEVPGRAAQQPGCSIGGQPRRSGRCPARDSTPGPRCRNAGMTVDREGVTAAQRGWGVAAAESAGIGRCGSAFGIAEQPRCRAEQPRCRGPCGRQPAEVQGGSRGQERNRKDFITKMAWGTRQDHSSTLGGFQWGQEGYRNPIIAGTSGLSFFVFL